MRRLIRRILLMGVIIIMVGAGYTAGFVLAPPAQRPVLRNMPVTPIEAPAPNIVPDLVEDA